MSKMNKGTIHGQDSFKTKYQSEIVAGATVQDTLGAETPNRKLPLPQLYV